MAEKKYNTFLNMVEANTEKGGTFISTVVSGLMMQLETRTAGDKMLITGTMPVNGRSEMINKRFGMNFDKDETVWITVQIWEKRAERFSKMLYALNNPDRLRITLVGALKPHTFTANDGTERTILRMTVNDWKLDGGSNSSGQNSAQNKLTTNTSAPVVNTTDESDMFDDAGFINLGDIDDDLPF